MAAAARSAVGCSRTLAVRKSSGRHDSCSANVGSLWMVRHFQPPRPSNIAVSIDRRKLVGSIPVMSTSSSSENFSSSEAESAAPSAAAQEAEEDTDAAAIFVPPAVPVKKMRVRFLLQEECLFGQQFLLVGDDPLLGLWDPTKGILLDWSEGHLWTTELDLPVDMSIEFKFILQGQKGELCWQPGKNRTVQTRDTGNILVVNEDWEDAQKQIISEEEALAMAMEDSSAVADEAGSKDSPMLVLREQAVDNIEAQGLTTTLEQIQEDMNDVNSNRTSGQQVLVPGLLTDSEALYESKEDGAEVGSSFQQLPSEKEPEVLMDIVDVGSVSESQDYEANTSPNESLPAEAEPHPIAGVIENDILWGRKVLQQFISSLGFKMNPTER